MKKLLLICLAALLPFSMWAASFTYDNIIYNVLDDTTCEVGDNENNSSLPLVVVIPEKVYDENDKEYTVVGIYELAFFEAGLTSVTIPETVTYVGMLAFAYCRSLASVYSLNPEPPTCQEGAFETYSDKTLFVPKGSKDAYALATEWATAFSDIVEIDDSGGLEKGDTFEYEGISYTVVDSDAMTCEVGSNEDASGEIVIPSKAYYNDYTRYTVVGVTKNAFDESNITSVTIPETVTYIGSYGFGDCNSLRTVYSLNLEPPTCDDYAFQGLDNCILYVPKGSKEAYAATNEWCTRFADIVEIGEEEADEGDSFEYDGMFYHITSISRQTVETAFSSELVTTYAGDIVIPETVEYENTTYTVVGIGTATFDIGAVTETYEGAVNITSVEIPKTVTYIGDGAFYRCTGLTGTLTIPSNITRIGERAYAYCSGLTELVIEYDEKPLFFDFTSTRVNSRTFYECPFERIYVDRNIEWDYETISPWGDFGTILDPISTITEFEIGEHMTTIPHYMCGALSSLKEIIIPDNITEMGTMAYVSCYSATKLSISKNLTFISSSAFANCSSLTKVEIPDNVTELELNAFRDCTSLKSVTLPSNLTTIGESAFQNCDLYELTIPEQVANIGSHAFEGNSNLQLVTSFNPEPPTCRTDVFEGIDDRCALYVPIDAIDAYSNADVWKDFFNILVFGDYQVFTLDATYITKKTAILNGTVEFLTEDEDKDDITEQGFEYWIDEDDVMTAKAMNTDIDGEEMSVLIQDLVENANYTYRAYAKTESDTYYGRDLVFSTSNRNGDFCVDGIYYNYGEEEGTCIVTYRDENYNYYSGVMDIPESVPYNDTNYTVVGVGTWAFYQSPELTEVTIPNTVTEVANQAFNGCDALVKATIGSSVETIGSVSFNCPSMLELISLNPTPPTCNENTFRDVDTENCILIVTDGTYKEYAVAEVWKDYFDNIVEMTEFVVDTREATDITDDSAVLNGYVAKPYYLESSIISEKGFEYWSSDPNSDPKDVQTITIDDEKAKMVYTLESLTPETTYTYRVFAVTEGGKIYGEEVEFTTLEESATGIDSIGMSGINSEDVEGIYSTSGQKLNSTVKGVNIIRYSDGTTKKVLQK